MHNKLEEFIRKNKDAFDDHEPSAALWSRLEKKIDAPQKSSATKIIPVRLKWVAAAAMIAAVAITGFYFLNNNRGKSGNDIAITDTVRERSEKAVTAGTIAQPDSAEEDIAENNTSRWENINRPAATNKESDPVMEEMYHYSQLIELRQKEMTVIKERDPELYNRFLKDLSLLEYSYNTLREKQNSGINSEQLLEAMIQNLKMQSDLLNKQLEITKHIKNQKENEKVNNL